MGLLPVIKVTDVAPGSIGEEIGLVLSSELISIDGLELDDFLDWEFLTAEEDFSLVYRAPGQDDEFEVQVERPIDDPLGVAVEPPRIKRCANRCDFCFVEGNPEGVRPVLYIRDDDYRLSFRYGNFATLTNLKQHDIDRIIRYRLSPLYVSVHATDPQVRHGCCEALRPRRSFRGCDASPITASECHTPGVMSPGVNDGDALRQTLADLWAFGPAILSVSVVPVGLTEFSKHHLVREPDDAECRAAVVAEVEQCRCALQVAEAWPSVGAGRRRALHPGRNGFAAGVRVWLVRPGRKWCRVGAMASGTGARRGRIAARLVRQADRGTHRDINGATAADGDRAADQGHGSDVRTDSGRERPIRPARDHRRTPVGFGDERSTQGTSAHRPCAPAG